MATRLIGTDSTNPRLPDAVILATQGLFEDDLAAGNMPAQKAAEALADANEYTDSKLFEAKAYTDAQIAEVVLEPLEVVFADEGETVAGSSDVKAVTPVGYQYGLAVVDIRSKGAVIGDATATTAAIQAAIDEMSPRGTGALTYGGTVRIPVGEWTINATILANQQAFMIKGDGPGAIIRWQGAAGQAMFNIQDSSRVTFQDLVLLGNPTTPPSHGIYFETPTIPTIGTNEYCVIERVLFGRRYSGSNQEAGLYPMGYGIRFGGAAIGNNDCWSIHNCVFQDCTTAGVFIENEQARWGLITHCTFNQCGSGVRSEASVTMIDVGFNRSTVTDVYIKDGVMTICGYWSEQSEKLWDQQPTSTLNIFGGNAQLQPPMVGNTYYAESFLAGKLGNLNLQGLYIEDQSSTGAKLHVYSSSSDLTPVSVFIRGCRLPNGNTDTGYDIDGNNVSSRLLVDIQQGAYWRRQIARTTNLTSSFELPRIRDPLQPTGTIAATVPRWAVTLNLAPTSGTLYLFGIELLDGDVITSLTFAALAAAVSPTNQWFGLFNSSLTALALTADDTTTAWAAQAFKTLALTVPVTITTKGLYYVGVMQAAATPATLQSTANSTISTHLSRSPTIAPICNAGLTAPPALPFTATAATTMNRIVYAYAT